MRAVIPVLLLLISAELAAACSVCGTTVLGKNTLREELAQAKAAVVGVLKNPTPDRSGIGGSTEFHFATVLKSSPGVVNKIRIIVPQYFPVIGDTPPDYLLFFDEVDGEPTITGGVPSTAAVIKYVTAVAELDKTDAPTRLAFYFKHLDDTDTTVAADAFLEFAKAADSDIFKAKGRFEVKKLVALVTDPKTPTERLGVFAALLGLCSDAKHTSVFTDLLKEPLADRTRANLGGVLAGYVLLEPKSGWQAVRNVLGDEKKQFDQRFAALGTLRFLQATCSDQKTEVSTTCKLLLGSPDFADLIIEDLRRWGWWELATEVFAVWGQPAGQVREVKKAVIRYALVCPRAEAEAFLKTARKADAKLVAQVEQSERLKRR